MAAQDYKSVPGPGSRSKLISSTPAAPSTTSALGSTNAIACVAGTVPGSFSAPDVARNVKVTFGAQWDLGDLTVTGTLNGGAVSETFTAGAGTTVTGTKIFDTITGATAASIPVKASGSITCVTFANLVDGDYFTLKDGTHTVLFEYDTAGDGVTGGRTAIDVSSGVATAAQVAAATLTAINGVTTGLTVTATNAGSGVLTLLNDAYGSAGNQANTENVANAGFLITGMTGGVGASTVSIGYGNKIGLAVTPADTLGMCSIAGVAEAVTVDATYPAFTPTSTADGAKVFTVLVNVTQASA